MALVYPYLAGNIYEEVERSFDRMFCFSIGSIDLILDAFVDFGSEHVLADDSVTVAAEIG